MSEEDLSNLLSDQRFGHLTRMLADGGFSKEQIVKVISAIVAIDYYCDPVREKKEDSRFYGR